MSKSVILIQKDTMDSYIDKVNVEDVQYIKTGDYQILYEECELHDVQKEDIVIVDLPEVSDLSEDIQATRMLKNDGKYYFYPLCDLYFE
jgi:hypothetical protein